MTCQSRFSCDFHRFQSLVYTKIANLIKMSRVMRIFHEFASAELRPPRITISKRSDVKFMTSNCLNRCPYTESQFPPFSNLEFLSRVLSGEGSISLLLLAVFRRQNKSIVSRKAFARRETSGKCEQAEKIVLNASLIRNPIVFPRKTLVCTCALREFKKKCTA